MTPLYIFDLDGTIALPTSRLHLLERGECPACRGLSHIDRPEPEVVEGGLRFFTVHCKACSGTGKTKPDWRGFYAACDTDKPNLPVIRLMERLSQTGVDMWIWSGRSDEVRDKTIAWLAKHTRFSVWNLQGPMLQMRSAGDHTQDHVLKRQWLDELHGSDRARLAGVFEDRARVVQMWREAGFTCYQVAPGDF